MDVPQKKRSLHLDVMNILACMSVVFLHHNSHVYNFDNTSGWVFSLAVECALFWAVPVFLMISGANLLDYHRKYSLKTYLSKRFVRTAIPWLIWSIILLVWKIQTGQLIPSHNSLSTYITLIITNQVDTTYWFFTTIFTCYLMLPVLTYVTPHKKILWYCVVLIFLLSSVLSHFTRAYGFQQNVITPIHEPLIIFCILGYLLNQISLTKPQRLLVYALGIVSMVFRFVYTLHFSVANQALDTTLKSSAMWHSVLLACAVFVFLKHVPWDKLIPLWLQKYIPTIAGCSFGVYLLHKIVRDYEYVFFPISRSGYTWKTLYALCTYLISLLIVFLLKKIPFIGKYLC